MIMVMRILKGSLVNGLVIDLRTPTSISYVWGFGSILGIVLVTQIVSGIILTCHYCPNVYLAYESVEHIMRDVSYGWLLRFIHANGASIFFIFIYLHIGKGIYYGSYNQPRALLWVSGVAIYFILMGTAFMGYILPWGQMSLWGATVITNMVTAIPVIGNDMVTWLWGGYSVDNPTLNRFFALHYLLPFILAALVIVHLALLHESGSSNPMGIRSHIDTTSFHPLFTYKDMLGFLLLFGLYILLAMYYPYSLGHPDNYIKANPLVTPNHICPEWYYLFAYAILRSIPSKLGGVVAMIMAILVLLILPFTHNSTRSSSLQPYHRVWFWLLVSTFMMLSFIGSRPAEYPYVLVGQVASIIYFLLFIITTMGISNIMTPRPSNPQLVEPHNVRVHTQSRSYTTQSVNMPTTIRPNAIYSTYSLYTSNHATYGESGVQTSYDTVLPSLADYSTYAWNPYYTPTQGSTMGAESTYSHSTDTASYYNLHQL